MKDYEKIVLCCVSAVAGALGAITYMERDKIKQCYDNGEEYFRQRIPEIKKKIEEFRKNGDKNVRSYFENKKK